MTSGCLGGLKRNQRPEKVCILSDYFYPLYPGHGTRYPLSVAVSLRKAGYKVTVITAFPWSPSSETPAKYRTLKAFVNDNYDSIRLIRLNVPAIPRISVFQRLLVYAWFILLSTFFILFAGDDDVVFGLGPYPVPLLSTTGFLWSLLRRKRYVAFMGDLWPDALFDLGIVKGDIQKRLVTFLHKFAFATAHHIAVLTNEIKEGLMKWNVPERKVSVIRMGVDTDLFRPKPKNLDLLRSINVRSESFIVMYSGILGPAYDFDALLRATKKNHHNRTHFIIRGNGQRKDEILAKIRKMNITNVTMLSSTSTETEFIEFLNLADVFVVPMMPVDLSKTAHPSKVFEFLSCAKPVICCAEGALAELIRKGDCGLAVKPGNSDALADAILKLSSDVARVKDMGSNGRELMVREFSYQSRAADLIEMLTRS